MPRWAFAQTCVCWITLVLLVRCRHVGAAKWEFVDALMVSLSAHLDASLTLAVTPSLLVHISVHACVSTESWGVCQFLYKHTNLTLSHDNHNCIFSYHSIHICMYAYTRVCMHVRMYVRMVMYVCAYVCIRVCKCAHMHQCLYIMWYFMLWYVILYVIPITHKATTLLLLPRVLVRSGSEYIGPGYRYIAWMRV